jgi:hypothetical protein
MVLAEVDEPSKLSANKQKCDYSVLPANATLNTWGRSIRKFYEVRL